MRKKMSLVMLIISVLTISACSKKTVELKFSPFQAKLSFGDLSDERIEEIRKQDGYIDVKANENKSLDLTIEEETYKELMKSLNYELSKIIEYMESSEDYGFIEKIEYDEEYSKIQIFINENELEKYKKDPNSKFPKAPLENMVFSLGRVLSAYKGFANKGEDINFVIIDLKSNNTVKEFEFLKDYNDLLNLN